MKANQIEKGNAFEGSGVFPEDGIGNQLHETPVLHNPFSQKDTARWSQSGIDVALTSLERIQVSLIRAAELFREDDTQNANRFFIQCIEGLQRFLEAVKNTRIALNIDFKKVSCESGTLADIEEHLLRILKGLFSSQQAKRYDEVADRIEYELLTNLSSWNGSLRKIQKSMSVF